MNVPGKLILFGEHFTVYGSPGIATQVPLYVDVSLQVADELSFSFPHSQLVIKNQPDHVVSKVYAAITKDCQLPNFTITVTGDLIPQAGLGYSAAFSRSLVYALTPYTNWTEDEQEERILYGERVTHGIPSGIDQACARHQGIIWYTEPIQVLPLSGKLHFALIDSGIRHNTREVVQEVAVYKRIHPERFSELFEQEQFILQEAKDTLAKGDAKQLGHLMKRNHKLLKELGVSTSEIELIITNVDDAYGAKITGAGKGGCVLVLCKDKEQQEEMKQRFPGRTYLVTL